MGLYVASKVVEIASAACHKGAGAIYGAPDVSRIDGCDVADGVRLLAETN